MLAKSALVGLAVSIATVSAQVAPVSSGEGQLSGPSSSPSAAGYSCDPNECKLPSCLCASTSPPGGIAPSDTPMFVVFTADDALQSYTIDAVNQFLAHRKNPNGCQPKMSFYVSTNFTNYSMVTDWFVAGNEIADHTMTHVGSPPSEEINGNLLALNAFSGIPLSAITGFRAPFLNYTAETLKLLHEASFVYDTSSTSSVPVDDPNTDAFWPYTLDNGLANDCLRLDNAGLCRGEPKLPGFWEVPMYSFFDDRGVEGGHLMDPWLDSANGNNAADDQATLEFMQKTFTAHYNGNRQPIGLYTHPIHVSLNFPGSTARNSTVRMINQFLDWAQNQQNVWIVSTEQLLAWVRDPKPISQLDQVGALRCASPSVDASRQICNGIPQNQNGLLNHCAFSDFPWYTCYGCPKQQPTPGTPVPEQDDASGQLRFHLPANCSTAFWDPVAGQCICNSADCQFTDDSRPIGPNGANLTGGGTGAQAQTTYVPFNDNGVTGKLDATSVLWTMMVCLVAAVAGGVGVLGH